MIYFMFYTNLFGAVWIYVCSYHEFHCFSMSTFKFFDSTIDLVSVTADINP
jgi:hypothetical protein